jgi:hypothetical protein
VASLIITKEILALQAERAAKEAEEKRKLLPAVGDPDDSPDLDDSLPAKVRVFWFHQEPGTPRWQLESCVERKQREEAADRGCWTG